MTTTWPLRLTLRAYSADEIVEYMQVYEGEDRTEAGEYILAAEHDRLMAEKDAEIERLRVALETLVSMEGGIYSDVSSAHNGRIGAAEWMREEDRDFRADLRNAFGAARAALGGDNG